MQKAVSYVMYTNVEWYDWQSDWFNGL